MKERLYICGPMTGLPDKNVPAFAQAQEDLIAARYTVYNPTVLESIAPADAPYSWFLRAALQMLLQSDAVALLPLPSTPPGRHCEATHVPIL